MTPINKHVFGPLTSSSSMVARTRLDGLVLREPQLAMQGKKLANSLKQAYSLICRKVQYLFCELEAHKTAPKTLQTSLTKKQQH